MTVQRSYGSVRGEIRYDAFPTDDRDTMLQRDVPPVKKYLVIPGPVVIPGGHPDDFHWVGARDLMLLYKVNPAECHIGRPNDLRTLAAINDRRYIVLRPRADGNYTLPTE